MEARSASARPPRPEATGAGAYERLLRGVEALARRVGAHGPLRPERRGIAVTRDVAYRSDAAAHERFHRLDVYRPADASGPLPGVLYLHGGGFQFFDKSSHWILTTALAREGAVVFNANYRLAPAHPFPAAAEDAAAAWRWIVQHASAWGADPDRLVLAGESAGANLALVVAIAACWPRPEPWARTVYELGAVPRLVLPACGLLEVERPERFAGRVHPFVAERIRRICAAYLPAAARERALASPLVVLEQAAPPERPFPACFILAGGRDPVCEDSRRLARALERLGVPHELRVYAGGVHAFHAFAFTRLARRAHADQQAFVRRHLA